MYTLPEHLTWLVLCIFFEARGEPLEGKVAVGHVIINRTIKRHLSVKEVIQERYQFSWYNENQRFDIPFEEFDSFPDCIKAVNLLAEEIMNGKNLKGADHYFNPNKVLPSWAENMKFIARIGDHDFYRDG